jgi:hypothetical protein
MRIQKSMLAVAFLILTGLACNRTASVATPRPASPTLTSPLATPSPTVERPTASPLPTATATAVIPSPTAEPTATFTPVIPRACPLPSDPEPPERPAAFSDYADVLAGYLSAGASSQDLEQLLRSWETLNDEVGAVRSVDMTGDTEPEIVVNLVDPAPEFDLPWPAGDLFIFKCEGGAVQPAYQGRLAADQELADMQFNLLKVEDVNATGRADAVYVTTSCGAHTCWDQLHIIEWDGTEFVDRMPLDETTQYPYATFTTEEGRVLVDVGGIGSAGAGYQRSYQELWEWDGRQYTSTEQTVGPPTALVHFVHDGDAALAQGDYGEAIGHYEALLEDNRLPVGLFSEDEDQGRALLGAYAQFKLVVAYTAAGDQRGAQAEYNALVAEHPEGTAGYPFTLMGQAFWNELQATDAPERACRAAVAVAEADQALAERLYAGYANPVYEPADLCRLTE